MQKNPQNSRKPSKTDRDQLMQAAQEQKKKLSELNIKLIYSLRNWLDYNDALAIIEYLNDYYRYATFYVKDMLPGALLDFIAENPKLTTKQTGEPDFKEDLFESLNLTAFVSDCEQFTGLIELLSKVQAMKERTESIFLANKHLDINVDVDYLYTSAVGDERTVFNLIEICTEYIKNNKMTDLLSSLLIYSQWKSDDSETKIRYYETVPEIQNQIALFLMIIYENITTTEL